MYARFSLQYLDQQTSEWRELPEAETGFRRLGTGGRARQEGVDFDLSFPEEDARYELRGVVEYQWRVASPYGGSPVTLYSARRTTSAGHPADGGTPLGFTAASCSGYTE